MRKKTGSRIKAAVVILFASLIVGALPSRAQDLSKLATDLAARIHDVKHERVTVVDFVDLDKKPSRLGQYLAQQLQATLAAPQNKLKVVDQSQVGALMEQMEKLNEGLIDPETKQELGKIASTEVVIVGTILPSSLTVHLDVKAIDLRTANLITAQGTSLVRAGLVDRLLGSSGGDEVKVAGTKEKAQDSAAKSHAPTRSRHDQGVDFDLAGCSLSGDALTCAVTVTSEARDRSLAVGFESRAWNDAGEEYPPDDVTVANLSRQSNCTTKQILKDVPTRMTVTFPKFGADDSMVERLRLSWKEATNCWDGSWRPVEFEKIAVSDDTDFSSSHAGGKGHKGGGKSAASGGNGSSSPGGFLQRLTNKAMDVVEGVIDNKTKKYTGDDSQTDQDGTTTTKKKSTKPPL
ncbi:MAG TPA: FlgO family outer membrane protein [Thermoanaerobaculia bacterium]